jgi:hypothetical protein
LSKCFREIIRDFGDEWANDPLSDVREILSYFLFEPNDAVTRTQIRSTLLSYLNKRRLTDVPVICDHTNNTLGDPITVSVGMFVFRVAGVAEAYGG